MNPANKVLSSIWKVLTAAANERNRRINCSTTG